ncbi:MAG: hypothetical protein ROZ64_17260 [Burkholderiaceae bacterium]|jgi:hypothetical protein|nr:hypothetical protein [Burkholderiaceae bacterium]
MENLVYALVQLVHNFGAVAVTAAPLVASRRAGTSDAVRPALGRFVAAAWAIQIASGVSFGLTSLHFYGVLPDLSAIARTALVVKVLCAAAGLALSVFLLARGAHWSARTHDRSWHALAGFGATALAGAAVLRWFS